MWQLDNRTPFAAERGWVRDRDGTEIWLVVIKASFVVDGEGRARVAPEQPEVLRGPLPRGDAASTSLLADADLVRTKLATDVIIDGQAHAPGGAPVTELDVGLAVGSRAKALKVFGDRVWQGRSISRPVPFTAMPIVWERAFGGADPKADGPAWDERNPVGQGFATQAEHVDGRPLPNIEHPDHLIRGWKDRPEPAGFGALCSHWTERRRFAGTYDDRWQRERLPLLPEDFDDRHYQCAPPDQQHPGFLRGGEPVALLNLTPGGGIWRFTLPRVFLGIETFFNDGHRERHVPPSLHTVILTPDQARVSLVFHSALPCHPRVLKLRQSRVWLKQDLRDGVLSAEPSREDGDDSDRASGVDEAGGAGGAGGVPASEAA